MCPVGGIRQTLTRKTVLSYVSNTKFLLGILWKSFYFILIPTKNYHDQYKPEKVVKITLMEEEIEIKLYIENSVKKI